MFKTIFWDTKNLGGIAPDAPVAAGLYILQVRYEPHLSDKVRCSEASPVKVN